MSQITDYLEQLHLSDIESKLYLTLLESGPVSVRELAETIDMKRTTAYLYIDQLITKGLVMKVAKGPHKLIAVLDPESSLKTLVSQKLSSAQALKEELPTILARINEVLPEGKLVEEADSRFYNGKFGVKKIYEDALASDEIRSFVNVAEVEEAFPENFKLFEDAFKRNPNIRMFEIVEDSVQAKKLVDIAEKRKTYKYKILPANMEITAQDIIIYNGKVGIINFKGNVHGMILQNAELYTNLKMLFDFIWKIMP